MNKLSAVSKFSDNKWGGTDYKDGRLRDFFLYRDLGKTVDMPPATLRK